MSSLEAGAVKVTAASGSTALTVALTGGSLADQVQIADVATVASIDVTGDLGTGTDNIAFTSQWATSTANQTFSISGLTYETSTLTGNSYGNTITGGAGVDTISTGDGTDVISGGAGADVITGGLGADTLTGGSGADTFFFDDGDSSATAYDTITDLGTTDKIKVTTGGSTNVSIVRPTVDDIASGTAAGITNGVASFTSFTDQTTVDTLTEKAEKLALITADNEAVMFVHGSDTFLFIETVEDDLVIKLTGVTVSQAGTVSGDGSTTGLTGFGA